MADFNNDAFCNVYLQGRGEKKPQNNSNDTSYMKWTGQGSWRALTHIFSSSEAP